MTRLYSQFLMILFGCSLFSISSNAQNFQWAKSMGAANSDQGNGVAVDVKGNVYTTGAFQGTVDFDPGIGVVNLTSYGSFDVYVSKLNAAGNLVWARNWGNLIDDRGYAIALDAAGNVYTTGYFKGTVDFDPSSAGTFSMTAVGADDMFISKLDSSGNFVWAKQIGGTDVDRGKSIAIDASGNILTTGYFIGVCDFDPGATSFNMTSTNLTTDIFVLKLKIKSN